MDWFRSMAVGAYWPVNAIKAAMDPKAAINAAMTQLAAPVKEFFSGITDKFKVLLRGIFR